MALFSALTLSVAAIGLYAVMAQAVSLRRRELVVRAALGASRARIVSMVLTHGLRIVAAGTLVGVVGALAISRWLASLLFGLAPTDSASYLAAAAGMTLTGLLASAVPAWRATRLSPAAVLKDD